MTNRTISLIFLGLGLLLALPAHAQISLGGIPKSFELDLSDDNLPIVATQPINIDALLLEDSLDALSNLPYRFAQAFPVSYNINNIGTWTTLPNGDRLWKLQIHCPGAKSINLLYDQFNLPPGGLYYIYAADRSEVLGAFSHHNNKASGKFATGLVNSANIVLEYFEPAAVAGQGIISVGQISHGYRSFDQNSEGLDDAGPCQVNVNCSEGADWQIQKKAVARYLINGTQVCSGTLINNVRGDCTPYFLTAEHCIDGRGLDAVTNPDISGIVFYWNYERPGCANSGNVPIETTAGATVVANADPPGGDASASDFALFELVEDPNEVYEVYMAGFDATGDPGNGGVGIHHPALDAKKIATHSIIPTSVEGDNYWRIYWDATPNGHSVTEGGSSGSGLFNDNKRLIGQLFGGFLGGQPNCSDPANDEGDYGKLSVSWDGTNTNDPKRRLRDWLDPDNTGTKAINGANCSVDPDFELVAIPAATNSCGGNSVTYTIQVNQIGSFTDLVTLSAIGLPPNATSSFSTNPVTPNNNVTLIIGNLNNVPDGTYTFQVSGNGSVGTRSVTVDLFDIVPNPAVLISPSNGAIDVSTLVTFIWAAESGVDAYDVQVATDVGFSNVIASTTVTTPTWEVSPALAPNTQHYWRVRHVRDCGSDPWSPTLTFTTNELVNQCFTQISTDVPVPIPSKTIAVSTIQYTESGIITDVNVFAQGEHTRSRDLIFFLQSPAGTQVKLLDIDDTPCIGGIRDFAFGFDDQSTFDAVTEMSCPTTDGRYYVPQEMLSAFNGEDLMGTWTLLVEDDRSGRSGDLLDWQLEICADIVVSSVGCSPTVNVTGNPITVDLYSASNSIQSNGTVQTTGNQTVIFEAGNFIQLNPGFQVLPGSNFVARIEACTANATETEIEARTQTLVSDLRLAPNPTTDHTLVQVRVSQQSPLQLEVYDLNGRLVKQLAQQVQQEAGDYFYDLDVSQFPTGIYIVALRLGDEVKMKKLSVVK
ncbi:MAG: 3-coathanger stack domain-containing protein [Bacteroidota bacterium]